MKNDENNVDTKLNNENIALNNNEYNQNLKLNEENKEDPILNNTFEDDNNQDLGY